MFSFPAFELPPKMYSASTSTAIEARRWRRRLVHVADVDCDGLLVSPSEPVGGLHDDLITGRSSSRRRVLEVGRIDERKRARRGVDREQTRVLAARDGVSHRLRGSVLSVAVTIVTAVVFSGIVTAAVSPPSFEVMTGSSFGP